MAFAPVETSRHAGAPVALYYFRYGQSTGSYYAWTDATHPITAPGSIGGISVTYTPQPIMRKNISQSGTLDKATIEISIPRDLPITDRFRVYPPSQVVSAVIRQGHLGETQGDYPACWVGRIVGFSFKGSTVILALEPFSTSMRRVGLRRNYQFSCPHVLFEPNTCRASKPHATTLVNVTSISGNVLTMPAAWWPNTISVLKYLNGTVEYTNTDGNFEIRMILQIINGKDLFLDGIPLGMIPGQQISAILGCNRLSGITDTNGDCTNLHVQAGISSPVPNIINFGGQPWIPQVNPVGPGTTPYY